MIAYRNGNHMMKEKWKTALIDNTLKNCYSIYIFSLLLTHFIWLQYYLVLLELFSRDWLVTITDITWGVVYQVMCCSQISTIIGFLDNDQLVKPLTTNGCHFCCPLTSSYVPAHNFSMIIFITHYKSRV